MTPVKSIEKRIHPFKPKIALVLGSGLSGIGGSLTEAVEIPYEEISGFPVSTVQGHTGKLICGLLEQVPVICMQGRFHLYEGYGKEEISIPIRTLKSLGCETLILTNAAGSLEPSLPPGSLMLIEDHINFSGMNPLVGPNDEQWGPRFFDMSDAYNFQLRQDLMRVAEKSDIKLQQGVYLCTTGPSFETPAEIKMFQAMGATAVGMSTVPECIIARHLGLKVLGISTITNYGAGLSDSSITHEDTLKQGAKASSKLEQLIRSFLKEWHDK